MLVHVLINRFLECNKAGIENSSDDLHENSFNLTMNLLAERPLKFLIQY